MLLSNKMRVLARARLRARAPARFPQQALSKQQSGWGDSQRLESEAPALAQAMQTVDRILEARGALPPLAVAHPRALMRPMVASASCRLWQRTWNYPKVA